MFSMPLNPYNPEDLRKCHAIYTKQCDELIDERNVLENVIRASAEFKQIKERKKQLEKQHTLFRLRISKATDVIWDMFLERKYGNQSQSPYYDKTHTFGDKTNIRAHVLSAISTVSQLNKLTPEIIRDVVRKLVFRALAEDKELFKWKERASVIDNEETELTNKERALMGTARMQHLDHGIYELRRELETIADMLANPNKYKRREDVAISRESVELNIDKIYATFKKLEAKAVY